ncbi:MAG: amidohydrolase [Clostridia bacterium]|nr:amidohydrolase [Clostridia bacterium]
MQQIISDRRALHRIPELDRQLDKTMAYLRGSLSPLRCALSSPIPGSLCAYFDNGAESTLAFRSDADALPVQEETGLPHASEHPGRMHACGHDGHMAMLLELARRLDRLRANRNFLLIFQPAEETTGGAKDICESGIFQGKNIEAIFGMHLWPELPLGIIASRANEMMARSCELTVEIRGKASHIAKAAQGIDALLAGAEFVRRTKQIEDDWPDGVFRLVRFGRMESGSVRNAISDRTLLQGTLRAFQDEVFFSILGRLKRMAGEISAETGCSISIHTTEGFPAVMNPPGLCERVKASGISYTELPLPAMTAEDFSWYQQFLPGMFFFLGCGPCPALHNGCFDFDEAALLAGADFLEKLAINYK